MDANGTNHYLDDMVELTLTGSAVRHYYSKNFEFVNY